MEARAALCAHRAMDAAVTRTALASYWVMKDFKEGKEVRWSTWMGIYLAVGRLSGIHGLPLASLWCEETGYLRCDDCHVCMRELLATRVVSSNRLSRGAGWVVCPVAVVLFADQPGAWHTVGGLRPRPFSIPLPQGGSLTLVLQTVL